MVFNKRLNQIYLGGYFPVDVGGWAMCRQADLQAYRLYLGPGPGLGPETSGHHAASYPGEAG